MTEIQEMIANLQNKIKKSLEDLAALEQTAAGLRSLISNDKNSLKRIVESMEDVHAN